MTQDQAYQRALQRVEQVLESGATELDLGEMGLTELPKSLSQVTHLQSLELHSNELSELKVVCKF